MTSRGQKRMRATLSLVGTIIGAGIFGVPAMIGAWGVFPATIGFIAVTFLVLGIHLYLAEAALRYKPDARLSGFARHWLGPWGAGAAVLAQTLQVFGSNLAYIILGGQFLAVAAAIMGYEVPVLVCQMLFWAGSVCIVMMGLHMVARVEAMLTWLLVAVMLLIIGTQVGRMDATILFNLPSHFTFEPYGIFLFAMLGLNVIPEMEDMVSGKREDLIRSVTLGTLGAGVLTYAFGVSAWLASSGALGRNPVELIAFLPPVVAILVPLFGFLAVITSYITSAYDLGAQFHLDFSIPEGLSWMTALGVPFLLLLLGSNDFIDVIGLVGSVFSASAAAVAVLVGRAALRASTRKRVRIGQKAWWWNEAVPLLICALLFLGAVGWLLLD